MKLQKHLFDFNTSHVTVYLLILKKKLKTLLNFNTSHVTVYRNCSRFLFDNGYISIHPMLRFIDTNEVRHAPGKLISIHPMLRFIQVIQSEFYKGKCISIHPMLRFIGSGKAILTYVMAFQYIPCYGLSQLHII